MIKIIIFSFLLISSISLCCSQKNIPAKTQREKNIDLMSQIKQPEIPRITIEQILAARAEVNYQENSHQQGPNPGALHYAVLHRRLDLVQTLIDAKADPELFYHGKVTPLLQIFNRKKQPFFHKQITELLLKNGANPLHIAYINDGCRSLLLRAYWTVRSFGEPLCIAERTKKQQYKAAKKECYRTVFMYGVTPLEVQANILAAQYNPADENTEPEWSVTLKQALATRNQAMLKQKYELAKNCWTKKPIRIWEEDSDVGPWYLELWQEHEKQPTERVKEYKEKVPALLSATIPVAALQKIILEYLSVKNLDTEIAFNQQEIAENKSKRTRLHK